MAGQFGIKETKEIVEFAVGDLAPLMIKRLKDGAQFSDALAFYEAFKNDGEFKTHLMAAFDKYAESINEVKDLDAGEGIELVLAAGAQVPKVIAALA